MPHRQEAAAVFLPRAAGFAGITALARVALAAAGLAACAGGAPTGRYSGPSPACPGGGGPSATLVRHGAEFALAPADGAIIVRGSVAADGAFAGSLVLRPASHATTPSGLTLSVTGRLAEDSAVLDYAAGTCHATLRLSRVRVPVL